MTRPASAVTLTLVLVLGLVVTPAAQAPIEKGRLAIPLSEINKPWTGDLSGMVERRMIRVLTTFSRTQYFID